MNLSRDDEHNVYQNGYYNNIYSSSVELLQSV